MAASRLSDGAALVSGNAPLWRPCGIAVQQVLACRNEHSRPPPRTGAPTPGADDGPLPADAESTTNARERTVNPSVFVLVAGLWLVGMSIFAGYRDTAGFDGRWNDRVMGALLIVVALIRIVARTTTGRLSLISVAVGVWLIAAPFVLGYGHGPHAMSSTWNDVIVGAIVVLLAGVSWAAARADTAAKP